MNKSVPTLLGIVIILLVVILVILIVQYQVTKGLGEGKQVTGTVGGEILTGVEAEDEYTPASALGGKAEPEEPTQLSPKAMERRTEAQAEVRERKERAKEGGEPVREGPLLKPAPE